MKQFVGFDVSFFYLEMLQMLMYVGVLYLLELLVGYDGDYVEDLCEYMCVWLLLLLVLRWCFVVMLLGLFNFGWVDVEFDFDEYIVEILLFEGSGMVELEGQVGLLYLVLLDCSWLLWKFYVFIGLEFGFEG